jgi:L-rhamnose mutarotase
LGLRARREIESWRSHKAQEYSPRRKPWVHMGSKKPQRGEGLHRQMNRRFCLTLDLKNDPALIAEYKRYHQKIWPEITQSIKDSGIEDMEIYLLGTRMFMIMEVNEHFSFEAKGQADLHNPKVQEWEKLMWKFQQSLPEAKPGEKWLLMERIFKLES